MCIRDRIGAILFLSFFASCIAYAICRKEYSKLVHRSVLAVTGLIMVGFFVACPEVWHGVCAVVFAILSDIANGVLWLFNKAMGILGWCWTIMKEFGVFGWLYIGMTITPFAVIYGTLYLEEKKQSAIFKLMEKAIFLIGSVVTVGIVAYTAYAMLFGGVFFSMTMLVFLLMGAMFLLICYVLTREYDPIVKSAKLEAALYRREYMHNDINFDRFMLLKNVWLQSLSFEERKEAVASIVLVMEKLLSNFNEETKNRFYKMLFCVIKPEILELL